MTEIVYRSDMKAELIQHAGSDSLLASTARVSTGREHVSAPGADEGLLNYLVRNRHGSPFEFAWLRWRIEVPIFVMREHARHRMCSYSETSGRYREMEPHFYVPAGDRPLVQVGRPGDYDYQCGDLDQFRATRVALCDNAAAAWACYQALLGDGVAKEVARMVLPVSLYTSAHVAMNLRALTNFLSLRTTSAKSSPMFEIEQLAEIYERDFERLFPVTYQAWVNNGREAI